MCVSILSTHYQRTMPDSEALVTLYFHDPVEINSNIMNLDRQFLSDLILLSVFSPDKERGSLVSSSIKLRYIFENSQNLTYRRGWRNQFEESTVWRSGGYPVQNSRARGHQLSIQPTAHWTAANFCLLSHHRAFPAGDACCVSALAVPGQPGL